MANVGPAQTSGQHCGQGDSLIVAPSIQSSAQQTTAWYRTAYWETCNAPPHSLPIQKTCLTFWKGQCAFLPSVPLCVCMCVHTLCMCVAFWRHKVNSTISAFQHGCVSVYANTLAHYMYSYHWCLQLQEKNCSIAIDNMQNIEYLIPLSTIYDCSTYYVYHEACICLVSKNIILILMEDKLKYWWMGAFHLLTLPICFEHSHVARGMVL